MARDSNVRIRILLLGAPGVGKNCLESRVSDLSLSLQRGAFGAKKGKKTPMAKDHGLVHHHDLSTAV